MAGNVCLAYLVAGVIRYLAINSEFKSLIADRIEISTPLNSWKRVTEAAFMDDLGIDPYSTDIFHDTPLNLVFYKLLLAAPNMLPIIFIVCDLLTASILYMTASKYVRDSLKRQEFEKATYSKKAYSIMLKSSDQDTIPTYVFCVFLFNPYIVLNCIAMTTTTFTNLYMSVAFFALAHRSFMTTFIALSLAASQTLYPSILVIPLGIYITENSTEIRRRLMLIAATVWFYLTVLVTVLYISYFIAGHAGFFRNTYGFILNVTDLRPNIGTTWYFFTEMFEHFRPLFLCALQINVSILYVVPLSLKFYKEPILMATAFTALTAMFRTYPSIGDVGFYLSLLPMWKYLFPFMQQRFIVCNVFLMTSVIAPIFWHLWIYSGAANANFYFGVTLAFTVAQIFVLTDLLFAYIKRQYFLKYGCMDEIESKQFKLIFW